LKKRTKKLLYLLAVCAETFHQRQGDKSFLVLFFKKERLAFYLPPGGGGHPARGLPGPG
jgi:hypothetical protein